MSETNGIYLGSSGCITLQRVSGEDAELTDLGAKLLKSDINTSTNTFSLDIFNIDRGQLPLTTGDRISITTQPPSADRRGEVEVLRLIDWEDDDFEPPNSLPTVNKSEAATIAQGSSTGTGCKLGEFKVSNGKIQIKNPLNTSEWIDADASSNLPIKEAGIGYAENDILQVRLGSTASSWFNIEVIGARPYTAGNLWFLPNNPESAVYYVNISRAGNISLYTTFDKAIAGQSSERIVLTAENDDPSYIQLFFDFSNSFRRTLAEVSDFTINTNREFVDTTTLGVEHQRLWKAGQIQGNGQMRCIWNYKKSMCGRGSSSQSIEFCQYLAEILIRTQVGAAFAGRFFLYKASQTTAKSVWYECDECLVQKVGVTVDPTQVIYMDIDFILNGPFSLQTGFPPSYLLVDEDSTVRDASGGFIYQEDESDDFEIELFEEV